MQNLCFICEIPCHWGCLKKKFSFCAVTSCYESQCVLYIFPQVLIVDLCADKFLKEVSEVTVPVTHDYIPGKGINERK